MSKSLKLNDMTSRDKEEKEKLRRIVVNRYSNNVMLPCPELKQ